MGSIFKSGIAYVNGGGNGKTLKWDEYQALPEAIKMNGDTYYISDIDSYSTNSFAPVIYSDDEREIGVWTDGKPLYQKTIDFGSLPSNGVKSVAHNISNLDRIVSCVSIAKNSSNIAIPIPYVNAGSDIVATYITNTNITIGVSSNLSAYTDTQVTIRYTKTTDQPGSGQWTPQGVPAHHYSTEEQIVGTWVDGGTMYEKTYVGTIGNYDSSIDGYLISADIDVTTIKELINIDGSLKSIDTAPAFVSLNGLKNTSNWSADIHINRYGILLWTGNSSYGSKFAGGKAVVTIRYTKSS